MLVKYESFAAIENKIENSHDAFQLRIQNMACETSALGHIVDMWIKSRDVDEVFSCELAKL